MTATDILVRIAEQRRRSVAAAAASRERAASSPGPSPAATAGNRFLAALEQRRGRAVIAEVKMGSPRLGSLRDRIDAAGQARSYAAAGAAALSVVVEPDFFFGSYALIGECRAASGLPVLAKDFVVAPVQLDWARDAGADAVLLIAALFTPRELRRYADLARDRGLVPLVEVHDEGEVEDLEGSDWELVGVNNRDLRTFAVDLERSLGLGRLLPPAAFRVAESGIASAADVQRLRAAGFEGFLVGEALLLAADPRSKLRELTA